MAVRQHPDGLTAQQIDDALQSAPPRRTLQYRLKSLVTGKRLVMEGTGRWARYRAPRAISLTADFVGPPATMSATLDVLPPLSEPAVEIREHVRRPTVSRTPVGYDREFLDSYRPNETFCLSESERELLQNIGGPKAAQHQPAGTYAKRLLNRLLLAGGRTFPATCVTLSFAFSGAFPRQKLSTRHFRWDRRRSYSAGGSRQQRLSDIAVAARPRQPDVARPDSCRGLKAVEPMQGGRRRGVPGGERRVELADAVPLLGDEAEVHRPPPSGGGPSRRCGG